jgi:hypothetical protein
MKMVPGPFCGGTREKDGEETSGSENETCLVAAGPPGPEPGSLPRCDGLPGVASAAVQALKRLTAQPDSYGEGAGAAAQNRVGAVVERLKGWDDAAPTQMRGAESSSLGRSVLELCLGKEGAETCKVLENFYNSVN